MATPYIGEIRMFAGTFAPVGWQFCQGQLLSITQYQVLFELIGTTYGGDGVMTFALPDFRGRIPLHQGKGFVIGELGGAETAALVVGQIPAHSHVLSATDAPADRRNPRGSRLAVTERNSYGAASENPPATPMDPLTLGASGGATAHNNVQPFLCVPFIIAVEGVFPSQA